MAKALRPAWAVALGGLCVCTATCLPDPAVPCTDGRICPPETLCDDVHRLCVAPAQREVCKGKAQLGPCTAAGVARGICREGVCLPERCGDGLVTGSEQCDGEDLLGDDCQSVGFYAGVLACSASCELDVVGCVGRCGDGAANGVEVCDGTDSRSRQCADFGWYTGAFTCNTTCDGLAAGDCVGFCGDGVVNSDEECDGRDQKGQTCLDFGADGGALYCDAACKRSLALCHWGTARKTAELAVNRLWGSGPNDIWGVLGNGNVTHFDGHAWTEVTVPNAYGALFGVWGSAPDDVWAVGVQGSILHFDGSTWTPQDLGGDTSVYLAVWGSAPNDVWAVGQALAHFDGTAWSVQSGWGSGLLFGVWGSGAGDVWAVGNNRTLLRHGRFGWDSVNPDLLPGCPEGTRLSGVWGSAPNDVWVVGEFSDYSSTTGVVLRFDGTQWRNVHTMTTALVGIWGAGPTDVWVVGDFGQIDHYNGSLWHPVAADPGLYLSGVWGTGPTDVWITGATGLYRVDGVGWQTVFVSGSETDFSGLFVRSAQEAWAVDLSGEVFGAHDGGWTSVSSPFPPLAHLWGGGAREIWALGEAGALAHFDNGSWSLGQRLVLSNGNAALINDVDGSGPSDIWAVGDRAFHFDGSAWKDDARPSVLGVPSFNGVWAGAANDVWIAAAPCACALHYDGSAWSKVEAGVTPGMLGVWGAGAGDVWLVGDNGVILHGSASGFAPVDSGTTQRLRAVWGATAADVWAVGDSGTALRFNGTTWSQVDSGTTASLERIWGLGPANVWAGGWLPGGAVEVSIHFDGGQWRLEPEAGPAVWGRAANDLWAIHSGTLVHFDGLRWTSPKTHDALFGVWGDAAGTLWAVGAEGTILRSFGALWTRVASGTAANLHRVWGLASDDIWAVGTRAAHFDGLAWTEVPIPVEQFAADNWLVDVWASASHDVWAVGDEGAILHFDGSAWQRAASGTEETLNGIWGAGPHEIWVVGSGGTLLHYDGIAWSKTTTALPCDLKTVWGSGPSDVWAAGDSLYCPFMLHFDGVGWSRVTHPAHLYVRQISGAAPDRVWAVGENTVLELKHRLPHFDGGACASPIPVACGASVFGSTTEQSPKAFSRYGCAGRDTTGAEAIYLLDNPVSGHVTLRLWSLFGDFDLIVVGAEPEGGCAPNSLCLNSSHNDSSAPDELSLPVVGNERLYLVLDGYIDPSGAVPPAQNPSYRLEVLCNKELPPDLAAH